jgi:hypothetical protein
MPGLYICKPADYRPYPGRRHVGNPFVEALPLDLGSIKAIQESLGCIPAGPRTADRKLADHIRLDELNGLGDCIYARAEYMRTAPLVISALKEAYYGRSPLTDEDSRRRHVIARLERLPEGDRLPSDWKSHAVGMALFGASGSGKTTFVDRILLPLQVVIEHTEYQGRPLRCRQVCALKLSIPHDGTVKSLCLQFFETVDSVLGTDYARQVRGVGGIAEMVLLIVKVVTAISLALLVIDEFQNLRAARGPQVEQVLNLFVQLMEVAGVSVLIVGTPAVQRIMETSLRNIRKLTSGFESHLEAMAWGSAELRAFQDELWTQQWTRRVSRLSPGLRRAWYEAGGGNPAFMVASFMFAQRIEIGAREQVDETSFVRASKRFMFSVQPAIKALTSGRREDLELFDDLIFTEPFDQLRGALNWQSGPARSPRDDEPDYPEFRDRELRPAGAANTQRRRRQKAVPASAAGSDQSRLPIEDPLARI